MDFNMLITVAASAILAMFVSRFVTGKKQPLGQMIISLVFMVAIMVTILNFWGPRADADTSDKVQSGEQFSSAHSHVERKPLSVEVDFVDKKVEKNVQQTEIDTDYAHLVFSSAGAALEQYEFKMDRGNKPVNISTVYQPSIKDRERKCFLVALDNKTPFSYQLISSDEHNDYYELLYRASCTGGTIQKRFRVYKTQCRVDLNVRADVKRADDNAETLRVLFPSPLMAELGKDDGISLFAAGDKKPFESISVTSSFDFDRGWVAPVLFGAQDRYFVHALVGDHSTFVHRAYSKPLSGNKIMMILEGPAVTEPTEWDLTFYLGPKEESVMQPVAPELEQTLDYGWFPFVYRMFLSILAFLKKYLHSFGWAIVVLTLLIRFVTAPFTIHGEQQMKKQAEYAKKRKYIEERYKHDKQKMNEELQKLGLPSMWGCLPMLLQLPVVVILGRVLSNSIELYREPFLWIPDLATKDPYFILPIGIFIAMVLHSVTTSGGSQQRVTAFVMGIGLAGFAAWWSAGLCVYIFVSVLAGVLQTVVQQFFTRA